MYMDYVKTYNEAARLNDFKVFLSFNYLHFVCPTRDIEYIY